MFFTILRNDLIFRTIKEYPAVKVQQGIHVTN